MEGYKTSRSDNLITNTEKVARLKTSNKKNEQNESMTFFCLLIVMLHYCPTITIVL